MNPTLLLIGIGNRDRGDDAAGPLIAEKLGGDEALSRLGVEAVVHNGEGASLMELWQGAEKVVIVDAMKSGAAAGLVRRFDAGKEKLSGGTFRYSSHLFSLAEGVELARQLGRLPDSLIVYGIEGGDFSFGAKLSPEVEKALEEVERDVRAEFTGKTTQAGHA